MIFGNLLFFVLSATALSFQRRDGPDVPTADRILAYLESASEDDQQSLLRSPKSEIQARLPDVLELSLFEGQERAFAAFLEYPTMVDWMSSDMAVHTAGTIVSPAKLISILDASAPSLSRMAPQSIQFSSFLVANQANLANVANKRLAQRLLWSGLGWGSVAQSRDAVKILIDAPALASTIPTYAFQDALWRSVETDDLSMFRLLVETESSWGRYTAEPSVWTDLFKRSIGYDFNIRSAQPPQRIKLMQYFLESERIMGALPSNIVNNIFSTAFDTADYSLMSIFLNNKIAMSQIGTPVFDAAVQKTIKNTKSLGGQGMAHLIVSKEESISRIKDEALGDLFVVSAKSGWTTAFDYVLTRPDLLDRISTEKFNIGLITRMEDHIDLAARLMLESEAFLAKMDTRSIGQVFISGVTVQDMAFIEGVLANDNIMIRVAPWDLYHALEGLMIRNVRPDNTANVMRMFINDKYISRLPDEGIQRLVGYAIKFNRVESLNVLVRQGNVVGRLETSFLHRAYKYVTNAEAKEKILAEIKVRPKLSLGDRIHGIKERMDSHNIRPIREPATPALPGPVPEPAPGPRRPAVIQEGIRMSPNAQASALKDIFGRLRAP